MKQQTKYLMTNTTQTLLRMLMVVICSCISIALFSETADALFKSANESYKQANYPLAIEQYNKILKQGSVNAETFYNLGNAYYKNNQLGLAILFYEKAVKLNPQDEDMQNNLKLANLKTIDRLTPVPELSIVSWWSNFLASKSSKSWAIFSVISIWIALMFFAVYLFIYSVRKIGFFMGIISLLASILFLYLAFTKNNLEQSSGEGVLLAQNSYIKSAPDTQSTDLFIIHEGIKFKVIDEVGEWTKIRLSDGKVGWLLRTQYSTI